jgi:hypothetical protein
MDVLYVRRDGSDPGWILILNGRSIGSSTDTGSPWFQLVRLSKNLSTNANLPDKPFDGIGYVLFPIHRVFYYPPSSMMGVLLVIFLSASGAIRSATASLLDDVLACAQLSGSILYQTFAHG